jgi:hypothetical protein
VLPVSNEKARRAAKIGRCETNKRQSGGTRTGQVPRAGSNPRKKPMDAGMGISFIGLAVIGGAVLLGVAMVVLVLVLALTGGRKDEPRND